MSEIKDLKKEHKKLEAITKKTTKKRLNDRTSDSWISLRELKKLKLLVLDTVKNCMKHQYPERKWQEQLTKKNIIELKLIIGT